MLHTHKGETISFQIVHKNRKSAGIYIDGLGHIEIRVPKGTKDESVLKLVEEKWEWILEHTQEMKDRLDGPKERSYDRDERFLYLGNSYSIEVTEDAGIAQDYAAVEGDKLRIFVKQTGEEHIQQALKRFYYQQCKALVEKNIQANQRHFKMKPQSIRISDSPTTWGTCDSNRRLTFNWKLAMAPPKVIEYVVIHEMCHMMHMNHDRSFWRLVGKLMPDYKEQERWLALSSWQMTV
jgi:predicted metal-dependent hydrolase